jgi:hypothetical protein
VQLRFAAAHTLTNFFCLSHVRPHSSLLLVQNSHDTCNIDAAK